LRAIDSQIPLESLFRLAGPELADAWRGLAGSPVYSVSVEGVPKALSPITQDEVFHIGREALSNAFQHAQATQIKTEIQYDEELFRLRIRDDGIRIDVKVLIQGARDGHWGLPGIRERAKLIGAHLEIRSDPKAGTEVELRIPSAIAYATSQMQHRLGLSHDEGEVSS
jgi:nitrate/nitrite-specific signal transduction histidine kinase